MSISDRRIAELVERGDQPDSRIDFSDIPELDESFFRLATRVDRNDAENVTLTMQKDVVDAFRRAGGDPASRMIAVLEFYARAKLG